MIADECSTSSWLSTATPTSCAPRVAHHAAVVVGDTLLTVGGLFLIPIPVDQQHNIFVRNIEARTDVFQYHFATQTWDRMPIVGGGPAPRFATAADVHQDLVFLFGGYSLQHDANFDDLWMLDPRSFRWTQLVAAPSTPAGHPRVWPSPRGYHNVLTVGATLFLFGGAACTPGCVCNNDLYALSLRDLTIRYMAWMTLPDNSVAELSRTSAHNISRQLPLTDHELSWQLLERSDSPASRSADAVCLTHTCAPRSFVFSILSRVDLCLTDLE